MCDQGYDTDHVLFRHKLKVTGLPFKIFKQKEKEKSWKAQTCGALELIQNYYFHYGLEWTEKSYAISETQEAGWIT